MPLGHQSKRDSLSFVRMVRVGSLNGPKIEATRRAVAEFRTGVEVAGMAVASGVSEQPVGWQEIVLGAKNRANAAFAAGESDLAVGIEDGLVEIPGVSGVVFNVGCAAVTDGSRESCAFSAAFPYPKACAEPALSGSRGIGEVFDEMWSAYRDNENPEQPLREPEMRATPSSMTVGNIGKLSLGVLNRDRYAEHAVICALLRFIHPDLYKPELHLANDAPGAGK